MYITRFSSEYGCFAWCMEHFPFTYKTRDRWWLCGGDLYFRDEDDFLMYKLVWG